MVAKLAGLAYGLLPSTPDKTYQTVKIQPLWNTFVTINLHSQLHSARSLTNLLFVFVFNVNDFIQFLLYSCSNTCTDAQ